MNILPWVLYIIIQTPEGNIIENDIARYDTKNQCVSAINGTEWIHIKEGLGEVNIIQRGCRRVHYDP